MNVKGIQTKHWLKTVFTFCTVFILSVGIQVNNYAKLPIVIGSFQDDAQPIAVVPFTSSGSGATYDFAALIARDLASTGEYEPMSRSDMVIGVSNGSSFNYTDWRLLGADVVITGEVIPTGGDNVTVQMNVFDTVRAKPLVSYKVPANSRSARAAAHHLSDVVYEKLTGVKGIFSTRIAYINVQGSGYNKNYELVVADVDGENQTVVARSPSPLMSPSWSPDSRRLAYVSFESGNSQIYVQDLATGSRTVVSAKEGINSSPAWSPDGSKLAMTLSEGTGNLDIHILDLATGRTKQLTKSRAIDTEAAWSEDGKTIYFTSDRAGRPQIYQISSRGGTAKRITFVGSYNSRPRVSSDGKNLAVVHQDDGKYQIALVNRNNGQIISLSKGRLDESPSLSPNGRVAIYATQRNGRGVLATVGTDGRSKPEYTSTVGDVREPAWSSYR